MEEMKPGWRKSVTVRLGWIVLMGAVLAPPSQAQSGPDLNDLVIDWSRGTFASPILCEVEGKTVRAIRRVVISPTLADDRRGVATVQFIDMKPEEATRCFTSTGGSAPNILGRLQLRVEGTPHPDTARRDFKHTLKKERGFELKIVQGVLRFQDVSQPPSEPRIVSFKGGYARLGMVLPATDADRELADFPSRRKALLELRSKSGEEIVMPLFLFIER
jgi:hypothetical protein